MHCEHTSPPSHYITMASYWARWYLKSLASRLFSVYSTVYSDADQRKCQSRGVTGFCAGNSPVTGEFPRQMASYAENVSIWWRHHEQCGTQFKPWGRQERALLATEKMNLPHLRLFFLTKQLIHLMWSRLSIKAIANYSCIPKCIHVYWEVSQSNSNGKLHDVVCWKCTSKNLPGVKGTIAADVSKNDLII